MRSTLKVRKIMQQFGKNFVFTNKYDNCRTVKCYAGQHTSDDAMLETIVKELAAAGVEVTTKRVIHITGQSWGARNSVIVRLPL